MPPSHTPLGSTPIQKLKRGYQADFSPAAEEPEASGSVSARPTDMIRQKTDARERVAFILGRWEQLSWHSHTYGEVCCPSFFILIYFIYLFLFSMFCFYHFGKNDVWLFICRNSPLNASLCFECSSNSCRDGTSCSLVVCVWIP